MATRKSSDSAANDLIPPRPTLTSLKNAAADCKACDLWLKGTQTVFGEGGRRARVMFVGEQPGNEESLAERISLAQPSHSSFRIMLIASIPSNVRDAL